MHTYGQPVIYIRWGVIQPLWNLHLHLHPTFSFAVAEVEEWMLKIDSFYDRVGKNRYDRLTRSKVDRGRLFFGLTPANESPSPARVQVNYRLR